MAKMCSGVGPGILPIAKTYSPQRQPVTTKSFEDMAQRHTLCAVHILFPIIAVQILFHNALLIKSLEGARSSVQVKVEVSPMVLSGRTKENDMSFI